MAGMGWQDQRKQAGMDIQTSQASPGHLARVAKRSLRSQAASAHTCTHIFWMHLHKGLKGRLSI
jgi:hypothetical protein